MTFDAFVSYPHEEKATADAACTALEGAGIRCWIAPRDVLPCEEWADAIVKAIDNCRIVVLIFSSFTNQSKQIHREVQRALEREKPVVPFRMEDVSPEGTRINRPFCMKCPSRLCTRTAKADFRFRQGTGQ
jgi:hypothetical protein